MLSLLMWRCLLKKSKVFTSFTFILLIAALLTSCETLNSNSSDALFYDDVNVQDSNLLEPFIILKVECMSCHNYHNEWLSYTSNQDWINAGLVQPGSAANSKLIHRMKNTSAAESPLNTNMPLEGSVIDTEDYQKLRSWIDSL